MIIFKKKPGADFTILNLTDLQMTGADWRGNTDMLAHLKRTVDELVKRAAPELITITGDFSYSGQDYSYECFAKWLDSYNIPWAPVFGNHDNQGGAECSNKIADIFMSADHCIFEKGEPELGCGNYTILITENELPKYALIMLDSHDRDPYTDADGNTKLCWAHLYPEQLKWYERQLASLGNVKNAILTHIPPYQYRNVWAAAHNPEYDPKAIGLSESFDPKYWNEGYKSSYGVAHENICSYPLDTREFDTIERLGSTDLILVGHDHINNFVIDYNGVTFAYSMKTGHGCYCDEKLNGGTVLRITDKGRTIEHLCVD